MIQIANQHLAEDEVLFEAAELMRKSMASDSMREASNNYSEIISKHPEDYRSYFGRAFCSRWKYINQSQTLSDARKSVELNPEDSECRALYCDILTSNDSHEDAILECGKVEPPHPWMLSLKVNALALNNPNNKQIKQLIAEA